MNRVLNLISICTVMVALSSGCSGAADETSRDLTRPVAKKVLDKSPIFNRFDGLRYHLPYDAVECAWSEALIVPNSSPYSSHEPMLSVKGARSFSWFMPTYNSSRTITGADVIQKGLPRHIVEITGITDAPMDASVKQVEFTWQPDDDYLPADFKPCRNKLGANLDPKYLRSQATTYLKRYDDGWRVQN